MLVSPTSTKKPAGTYRRLGQSKTGWDGGTAAPTELNSVYYVPTFGDLEMGKQRTCLLYTSPSPRDRTRSRMPSSA